MLNGVPRILIVRLSAIGDVVRVLPALHALRDRYPNAQIDWAVEPKSQDVISDHPMLDQVLVYEREEGFVEGAKKFREFCRVVKGNRYDIVVDFHGLFKTGLIMRASRAKRRICFAPPRAQEMSHLFGNERVSLVSGRMNRVEENLELCKELDAKRHTLDVIIAIPEAVQDGIDDYIADEFHGDKDIINVHVPVDRKEKQWPLSHYAALVDMLLSDGRFEVLLTRGPGQESLVEEVLSLARRKPHVAPETPDLKHYAALVQHCALYVGGDTGPMHIAAAMGTPVLAIFGGTSPEKHGPMQQPARVLYKGPKNLDRHLGVDEARPFLEAIAPEEVYDTCIEMLFGKK
ncbi:MAG: glycosyltransferase family 9 protein [Candidatus Hydrogenedentes bacterium]|nr:glycosyltransferase family 9 protein [Candidatus Hydrogenedentota bacterium]